MEASIECLRTEGRSTPWRRSAGPGGACAAGRAAMQMRTALIVIAIVVGLVAWLLLAPVGHARAGRGAPAPAEVAERGHDRPARR